MNAILIILICWMWVFKKINKGSVLLISVCRDVLVLLCCLIEWKVLNSKVLNNKDFSLTVLFLFCVFFAVTDLSGFSHEWCSIACLRYQSLQITSTWNFDKLIANYCNISLELKIYDNYRPIGKPIYPSCTVSFCKNELWAKYLNKTAKNTSILKTDYFARLFLLPKFSLWPQALTGELQLTRFVRVIRHKLLHLPLCRERNFTADFATNREVKTSKH